MFSPFLSMEISPDCHDLSSMMDCISAVSSASSFRTHGWISLSSMYLCTFMFFRLSQTWYSFTEGRSSFSLFLPLLSATWTVWLEPLPFEDWRIHWAPQLSSHPSWPRLQFPPWEGQHLPYPFFYHWCTSKISFCSPSGLSLDLILQALAFPGWSLATQTTSF